MSYLEKKERIMRGLIKGGSKGIGYAAALRLQDSYDIILHASAADNLAAVMKELKQPDRHSVLCADLSSAEGVKNFCAGLKKNFSEDLYGVINNAGVTLDKSLLFQPEADIDKMLQVNLKAPIMIS